MVLLPVRGLIVHVDLPLAFSTLIAQFLVSCGLSRERVDKRQIQFPQAWSEQVCSSVRNEGSPDSREQIAMKRAKLPIYWRHSAKDRPRWLDDAAIVAILLTNRTPAGVDTADALHPDRPPVIRAAFEAIVGHAFDGEPGCVACTLADRSEVARLLRSLEVDPRAVWDLFKAFQDMFWLPDLKED